jgi:hypothetical protein
MLLDEFCNFSNTGSLRKVVERFGSGDIHGSVAVADKTKVQSDAEGEMSYDGETKGEDIMCGWIWRGRYREG